MKRLFYAALAILLGFTFVSCGGETEQSPQAIFRAEKIALAEGFAADFDGLSVAHGRVHVTGYDIESNLPTSLMDVILQEFSCGIDGTDAALEPRGGTTGGVVSTVYTADGGMVETETFMSGPTAVDRVIIRHTAAGGTVREYDCAEIFGLDPSRIKISELDGSGGFFVHAAYETEAGLVIVSTTGAAVVADGAAVSLLESKTEITDCAMADGRLILIYNKDGQYTASYADPLRAQMGDALMLPAALTLGKRQVELFSLNGYTLGLRNDDGIYGLTEADGTLGYTLLCDLITSGVVGTSVTDFAAVSPDVYFALLKNEILDSIELYRLERMEPEEASARKTLTAAYVLDCDTYARQAAVDVNLSGGDTLVELVYYNAEAGANGTPDYDAAFARLDLDIAAGDVPDVLILSANQTDMEKYTGVGLFADLYALIDADADFSRESLTPVARRVGERDGKLLYLPTSVDVRSFLTREPSLAGKDKLTFDEFVELATNNQPCMARLTAGSLLNMLTLTLEEFVRPETGEVSFDTAAFRDFVELWAKAERKELYSSEEGEYALEAYPYLNRPSWLADELAQHEELHVIGYPDTDGSGVFAEAGAVWAISSGCADKAAAWQLIRARLNDAYLAREYDVAAPLVTMSAYEKFLARYADMAYYYHGGKRTQIEEPMTAAEAAKEYGEGRLVRIAHTIPAMDALVMSAVPAPPYADAVKDILREELSAYEAGTVSADAAIERMEKRVRTYVSERYG